MSGADRPPPPDVPRDMPPVAKPPEGKPGIPADRPVPGGADAARAGQGGADTKGARPVADFTKLEKQAPRPVTDAAKAGGTPNPGPEHARPTAGGQPTSADVRAAVRDAKAAGIKVDIEAQPHKVAPAVRAEKGVSGSDVQSAHTGPTSALRDTTGYVRGDALTAAVQKATHQSFDKQWQASFRELAGKGHTEITVRDLYNTVSKAIQDAPLPGEKPGVTGLTPGAKGTLQAMLFKELYGDLGLKADEMVRMPYSKPGGAPGERVGPQPKTEAPKTEPRIEPKGPALNDRGEVKGSKADGATAEMEAAEGKGARGAPVTEPTVPGGAAKGLGRTLLEAGDKLLHGAGKVAGAAGNVLNVVQAVFETREIIARERPDLLPDNSVVQLKSTRGATTPEFSEPSGYVVEKKDGHVRYLNADGKEVTRDEAIRNSEMTIEDRKYLRDHGA